MSYPTILPNIGNEVAADIDNELCAAKKWGAKFNSLHEAHGVIAEELDEVWDITKKNRYLRDPQKLRKELIQIAAMAIKAIHSMENLVGENNRTDGNNFG